MGLEPGQRKTGRRRKKMERSEKKKSIPVVIFHVGCPGHLPYSVHSAERYNDRVILLGDEANRHVAKEWFDHSRLDLSRYNEFLKVFENYSTYTDFFAQICFKRYFLYYELMKELGFDRIVVAESDLYNCADYSALSSLNGAYAMVSTMEGQEKDYGWSSCCHCSYWTMEALDDFLGFCENTFRNGKELLLRKWNYQKEHGLAGGVCDMTLVYLWSRDNDRVLNSAKVFDGGTIDQNLCDRANFSENEYRYNSFAGIKKYVIKRDSAGRIQPYLVKNDGTLVRVFAIHCSGRGKSAIKAFDKSYMAVCASQIAALFKMRLGRIKAGLVK